MTIFNKPTDISIEKINAIFGGFVVSKVITSELIRVRGANGVVAESQRVITGNIFPKHISWKVYTIPETHADVNTLLEGLFLQHVSASTSSSKPMWSWNIGRPEMVNSFDRFVGVAESRELPDVKPAFKVGDVVWASRFFYALPDISEGEWGIVADVYPSKKDGVWSHSYNVVFRSAGTLAAETVLTSTPEAGYKTPTVTTIDRISQIFNLLTLNAVSFDIIDNGDSKTTVFTATATSVRVVIQWPDGKVSVRWETSNVSDVLGFIKKHDGDEISQIPQQVKM